MGNRPSKPNRYRRPRYGTPPVYNAVPTEPIQQQMPTMGQVQKSLPVVNLNPIVPPPPIIYDSIHQNDEYVDVIGSDAGNMTVFSWITQIGTCCASVCTLIVLVAFVIWMFLNRNINTLP